MFINKGNSPLMRFIAFFLGDKFLTDFWTTWRLPFQEHVRIGYPSGRTDLDGKATAYDIADTIIVDHELVHATQFRPWYGPWWVILFVSLFPLPVLFSGRWFVERRAYLKHIKTGYYSVDAVVDALWHRYGWCWPKPLMRRWFAKQLESK